MKEKEPLLDGEYEYSFESTSGGEVNPERTFGEELAITTFTGNMSDLPKHFKRNLTVDKAERFEEGDKLLLNDGHVSKWNHEFDEFHVTAHDDRQKYELDLDEMGEDELFCPFCGEKMWESGKRQKYISCNGCRIYFDIFGKGEQIVFEGGP